MKNVFYGKHAHERNIGLERKHPLIKRLMQQTAGVPGVEEDELHVQTGSEHKHVAVQFDLSHSAGRQGVTHSHQTHVLVAALEGGHVQTVLTDLQVAAAVDHLWWSTERQ